METVVIAVAVVVALLVLIGIGYLVYMYLQHHPMRDTIEDLHNQMYTENIHGMDHHSYHYHDGY